MKGEQSMSERSDIINPYKLFVGSFIPNWLLKRTEVSPNAKLCYARLCQYAGEDGRCYPKQETLASELGIEPRTVKRLISELVEHRLIIAVRSGLGKPNNYYFIRHEWMFAGQSVTSMVHQMSPQGTSNVPTEEHELSLPSIKTINEENPTNKLPIKQFLQQWGEMFQVRFQTTYVCNFAKDTQLVKKMLQQNTFEELIKRVGRYFQDNDVFVAKNGYTIGIFYSRINSYSDSIQTRKEQLPNGNKSGNYKGYDESKYPTQ